MLNEGKKTAVGYIRVSTDEQATNGVGLATQTEHIRLFAKSQGWEVSEIIRDEMTGTRLDRPGLERVVEGAKSNAFDVVLVYKIDRLARKQSHLLHLVEEVFEKNDVGFKSVTQPFDTTTAMGKAFLGMLGVFAQLERDTISERTRDALAHKKVMGVHCGRPPFGYRRGKSDRLEKDPVQQKTISRIKRLRGEGRSLREISGLLSVPKSSVHKVLKTHMAAANAKYLRGLSHTTCPQSGDFMDRRGRAHDAK